MKTKMIKIGISLSVILFATACEKNYICQCTRTYTRSNGTVISEYDGAYAFKDTKIRATNRCTAMEGYGSDLSGEYTRNCELK